MADMQEEHVEIQIGGTLQQRIANCMKCMDLLLRQSSPIVSSMVVAEKKVGSSGNGDIVATVATILGNILALHLSSHKLQFVLQD